MELVRALERPRPSRRTEAGPRLRRDRATTSLMSSLSSTSPMSSLSSTSASSAQQNVSVQRSPLQDLFSFASSLPLSSRTSVEAMLKGTRIRMVEMSLKMQHRFPRPQTQEKGRNQAGVLRLTAATDLNRRHRLTLESTLGSDADKQSVSTFVSSKFESKISWGLAVSHKVHRTLTFFSRYNSDDHARSQFIVQVVHKLNEETSLSPIVSLRSGRQPEGGFSLTRQLTEMGFFGNNFLQVKGFFSGGGAYSLSIKAKAGQID